jgi:DNA polymerase I
MLDRLPFRYLVAVDAEYEFGGHASLEEASRSGERPRPVCLVAKELRSGRTWRLWRGEFGSEPPFPTGPDALLIAYYSSAEWGTFLADNWRLPVHVLDLYCEFRARTNGRTLPNGRGLLGALTYFGIDGIDVAEKRELQTLIVSGGPWSAHDRAAIVSYCESDVLALERLLPAMLDRIDLPRALLRGRFMKALAPIEWAGTPINVLTLHLLRRYWTDIQDDLIAAIDKDYGVFDGRSFRADRWERWLAAHGIPWPRHESGRLNLSDDTFREMARAYPAVAPMRELRSALSDLRLHDLAVGSDGRNRAMLSAFGARSGRCTPSNTRYIFGPSVWLRSLIAPPPGYGVAYVDWEQQEFGIAGVLSGDEAMQAAYLSGDPYLAFAKQAGAVPVDATAQTHVASRELFKRCALGVIFGMEEQSLAHRISQPRIVARDLLRAHHETYRQFWKWSDAAVDHAVLTGSLSTVFGWPIHVGKNFNPRSLRNYAMQGGGADMLRVAACFAVEQGIEITALIHDAMMVCAPLDRLADDIARTRECMAKASRAVLDGFELRTEVKEEHIVRHPDHYCDPRGKLMFERVMRLIAERQAVRHEVA